jgi:hypothetical protein
VDEEKDKAKLNAGEDVGERQQSQSQGQMKEEEQK